MTMRLLSKMSVEGIEILLSLRLFYGVICLRNSLIVEQGGLIVRATVRSEIPRCCEMRVFRCCSSFAKIVCLTLAHLWSMCDLN